MSIGGLIGSDSWTNAGEIVNPYLNVMYYKTPKKMPLTQMLMKVTDRKQAVNNVCKMFELDIRPTYVLAKGAFASTVSTIQVTDGSGDSTVTRMFHEGLILRFSNAALTTTELARVATDPTVDGTLVLTRGYAGTTAINITNGMELDIVGQTQPEGGTLLKAGSSSPASLVQYLEEIKKSVTFTSQAAVVELQHTADPYNMKKVQALSDMQADMEMAALFHELYETTGANGQTERMCNGFTNFCTNQIPTTAGSIKFADLVTGTAEGNGLALAYRYGDEKVLFAGSTALSAIWNFVQSNTQFRVDSDTNEYGFHLTRIRHQLGSFVLLPEHPLMSRSPALRKMCIGIDFNYVGYRYLKDHDVQFLDDQQPSGSRQRSGQWIHVGAPMWRNAESGFVIPNLSAITLT